MPLAFLASVNVLPARDSNVARERGTEERGGGSTSTRGHFHQQQKLPNSHFIQWEANHSRPDILGGREEGIFCASCTVATEGDSIQPNGRGHQ